ncbi:hypothetical protein V1512DRAFT_42882 [Lipomyces arxii]|uniref:uncharacterized protein n=1 Tax=Lipomyces arxii TaxID=56418 RepID=UPI0034CFF7A7
MNNSDPAVLPSIMFTTAAQLVDCVDKRLLVVLRDGRKLFGILRSFDQYANLVLQETTERIIVDDKYCDMARGVYIIRGENVVLVGEVDPEKEKVGTSLRQVSVDEIYAAQEDEVALKRARESVKTEKLSDIGFSFDSQYEDMY